MKLRPVILLLSIIVVADAHGQAIDFAFVGKRQKNEQTGDGLANVNPVTDPWQLDVGVSGGNVSASFPTPPNGLLSANGSATPAVSLEYNVFDAQWKADSNLTTEFPTQAALDANFTNGNYTFNLNNSGASAAVSLTGDMYPNVPFGNFSQGTWSGGTLYVDPSQALVITTNIFSANFTSGLGRIEIVVGDAALINNGPGFSTNSLTLTINPGTLVAGNIYDSDLEFASIVNLNSILGGTAVAIYTNHTEFQIQAIPEPATTALITSVVALGGVLWRRRHQGAGASRCPPA